MNNKLKILIIFSIVLFAGLFISAKSAKAQTFIDWFPTPTGLSASCGGSGTTANLSWNDLAPYESYVRIWDDTAGAWAGLVPEWWNIGGADAMSIATSPGHGYTWWVHARDGWGNWGPQSTSGFTCANPPPVPTCSSSTPDGTAVYNNETPRFYAWDVANATAVLFYTWSESGGQNDLIARWGTQSGSTWYVDVGLGSHPGDGNVITHVYMYNAGYSSIWCDQSYVTQYAPLATAISASPTSVAYGGSSTISWSSTSASSCGIGLQSGGPAPPGGTGGPSGSWVATGITSSTQYFISCNGVAGGNTGSYSQVITPGPPPPSCTSVDAGGVTAKYNNETVTFYARGVANATAVWFPTRTATGGGYTWLAGTNAGGGTWYATATLSNFQTGQVASDIYMYNAAYSAVPCGSPSITSYPVASATLSANPGTVGYGGSFTLTWSSVSTTTCAVGRLSGNGPVPPGGTGGLSGSWTANNVTGSGQSVYNISCLGVAGGNPGNTASVTITVQDATGVLESNANSSNNNNNCNTLSGWAWDPDGPNTAIQLHIYHNGAFYTNISAGDFRGDLPGNQNHGFTYTIPGAWKDGAAHNIAIFSIDLNGGNNSQIIYSPVVALVCTPPTVDIKANGSNGPISINYNTSATLSWTSANAASCILYVNNLNTGWTGTNQPNVPTGNMTSANVYRVDCTGTGGTATDSVTININQQPTCAAAPNGATPDGEWVVGQAGTRATQTANVANATVVYFATFTDAQTAANAVWYSATNSGGGVWTYAIPLSAHPEVGNVNVHVYMNNANYTGIFCDSASFIRHNSGTINVNSNTPTSWTINCSLTNPACPNVNSGGGLSSGSYPTKPYSDWTITPANISGYDWKVNSCALNTPCQGTFQ